MRQKTTVKHIFATLKDFGNLLQNRQSELSKELDTSRLLLQRVVEFELFTIFQYDVLEKKLLPAYLYGTPFNLVDSVNFKLGKGATARCFNSTRPLLISNLNRHSDRKLKFVNSFLAVPLIFDGENVGVMVAGHSRDNFFGKSDLFFFELVAPTICMQLMKGKLNYAIQPKMLAEEKNHD
ncbi:MAG: hypothetical protein Kow0037_17050 [Calditrichia bacterium]